MIEMRKLKEAVAKFSEERDWDQFHTPKNLAAALNVEAGELLEIFQWLTDEQANASSGDPYIKSQAKEELADVFIYLVRLADKMGIDLFDAAFEKLEINKKKYPVELSKGNAVKYNQRKDA